MHHPSGRALRSVVLGVSGCCLLVAIVGSLFFYRIYLKQADSPTIRRVAHWFQLPAARVGDRRVPYTEYLIQVSAAKKFLLDPAARAQGLPTEITPEIRGRVLDQAMFTTAVEEFAAAESIVIEEADVTRAYDELVSRAGTSTSPEEIRDILQRQYGWTEQNFRTYVIRPALLEDALKQKRESAGKNVDDLRTEIEDRLKRDDVKRYIRL